MDCEMDSLISRIRARIADPHRAVDAATWVEPMPRGLRPATAVEVAAAEQTLGFAIPLLLRRLYLEVANGGFGPNYGLEGVPMTPEANADIVVLYQSYLETRDNNQEPIWPVGLVPLISGGCLYMECVDFLRPPHSVVLFDPYKSSVVEWFRPVAVSLEARLEAWLAGQRVWTPAALKKPMLDCDISRVD